MGFVLQVASSAASRLVYMYLLGLITQLEPGFAVPHAAVLANASGLAALFALNAFLHYLSKNTAEDDWVLRTMRVQFELLVFLLILAAASMLTWGGSQSFLTWITVMVGALALALPEVVFTMASVRKLAWRPLVLYGGQALFYLGYIMAVAQKQAPDMAVLYGATPTLLICLVLAIRLRIVKDTSTWLERWKTLASTLRLRLGMLASSVPVIAMPPALVYLMQAGGTQADQIPQMLLFISFSGALAFLMGNVFQHFGKDLVPRLLVVQEQAQTWRLLVVLGMVMLLCAGLAWPIDLAMKMFKDGFQIPFDGPWVAYAVIMATSAIMLQWHTVISLHHGQPRSVLRSNVLYLGLGCLLVITTPWHGMSILSILAASAAARASLNLIDFTSASKR